MSNAPDEACYYVCSSCLKRIGIGFAGSPPHTIDFCDKCGGKLVKKCKCGKLITKSDSEFCMYCGAKYGVD